MTNDFLKKSKIKGTSASSTMPLTSFQRSESMGHNLAASQRRRDAGSLR